MKRAWLLVLNIFSVFVYSADLSIVELPRMIEHFKECLRHCKDTDKKNVLLVYKSACEYVIENDYKRVPYSILYKLECARAAAILGYDIVNTLIWPKISDWKALKLRLERLKNYEEKKKASGLCSFFSLAGSSSISYNEILLNGKPYPLDLRFTNPFYMSYGNPETFYAIQKEESVYYLLLVRNDGYVEKLLPAPLNGLLFACGFYYGSIDYTSKEGFLYKKSESPSCIKIFDLGKYIPWDTFNVDKEEVETCFFEDDDNAILCFRFFESKENASKPLYYKITIGFDS